MSLQIDEDLALQAFGWRIERTAVAALGLFCVLAAFGAFGGGGPLSERTLEVAGGKLDFPRFARSNTEEVLRIEPAPGMGSLRVVLKGDFIERMQILSLNPRPSRENLDEDGIVFDYDGTIPRPRSVFVRIVPHSWGKASLAVSVGSGATTDASQFVFP